MRSAYRGCSGLVPAVSRVAEEARQFPRASGANAILLETGSSPRDIGGLPSPRDVPHAPDTDMGVPQRRIAIVRRAQRLAVRNGNTVRLWQGCCAVAHMFQHVD